MEIALTPRVQTRKPRRRGKPAESPGFEFTQAIAMEHLRTGLVAEISRGMVYPIDHPPQFWRALGPRPDEVEVTTMAANEKPKLSAGAGQQPPPKLIDNAPASSVATALANNKKQVDAAK
jgi:hypothetical protein